MGKGTTKAPELFLEPGESDSLTRSTQLITVSMVAANVFKHERSQGSHLGPPIACTSLAGADPHDPENVACLLPKLSVSKEKKTDMKLSRCLLPVGKCVDSAHYFHQLQLLPLSFKV